MKTQPLVPSSGEENEFYAADELGLQSMFGMLTPVTAEAGIMIYVG